MMDLIPARGSPYHILLLMFAILTMFGCSETGHLFPPTAPQNLNAVFTENIFGTDGVWLIWEDTNGFDDIGFTVYRDGREVAHLNPLCLPDESGNWVCSPINPEYFDTDVDRGETHCYAMSSYYYDWLMDLIFEESDKCPEVCIDIPLQGFTRSQTSR